MPTNRERCLAAIEYFSEEQAFAVAEILELLVERVKKEIAEISDDVYCEKLYREYLSDPERELGLPVDEFAVNLLKGR